MDREEFNKIWDEWINEYEIIPDKTKIKNEDKEFIYGYICAITEIDNAVEFIKGNYEDEEIETFKKLKIEMIEQLKIDIKEDLESRIRYITTSILDSYIE